VSNAKLIPITAKETEVFIQKNHPIHLTLLSEIINTSGLVEKLVPYLDKAVVLAFEQSKSPCDTTKKAAGSLLKAVTNKLANISKFCAGNDLLPPSIAYDDLFTKYPEILSYITENIGITKALNILLLEFLCHFEYRKICLITDQLITGSQPIECENIVYKKLLQKFIEKPELVNDEVELLVGKLDAQTENLKNLPNIIENNVATFLQSHESRHFYAISFGIKRYETYGKHMLLDQEFYERIKVAFAKSNGFMELRLTVKDHLRDLLTDIGFNISVN
jgi:hypothetical protein